MWNNTLYFVEMGDRIKNEHQGSYGIKLLLIKSFMKPWEWLSEEEFFGAMRLISSLFLFYVVQT